VDCDTELTRFPPGVNAGIPSLYQDGDEVTVDIEGVGRLEHAVTIPEN
jgi:2-keto-4-pentenoate hydratase/2-oxohepta-3-ene-1,7-dioic acid hydratase in catechol pathway